MGQLMNPHHAPENKKRPDNSPLSLLLYNREFFSPAWPVDQASASNVWIEPSVIHDSIHPAFLLTMACQDNRTCCFRFWFVFWRGSALLNCCGDGSTLFFSGLSPCHFSCCLHHHGGRLQEVTKHMKCTCKVIRSPCCQPQ